MPERDDADEQPAKLQPGQHEAVVRFGQGAVVEGGLPAAAAAIMNLEQWARMQVMSQAEQSSVQARFFAKLFISLIRGKLDSVLLGDLCTAIRSRPELIDELLGHLDHQDSADSLDQGGADDKASDLALNASRRLDGALRAKKITVSVLLQFLGVIKSHPQVCLLLSLLLEFPKGKVKFKTVRDLVRLKIGQVGQGQSLVPILDEDTGPDLSSEVKPPSVSTQAAPLPGKADDDDTKPDLVFRPPSAEPADDTVSGPALTSCAGEPVEGLLMVDFDDLPVVRQGLDDSFDVTDLRTPPSFPEVAPPAASPESALEETRPVPDFEPPEDRSDEDLFADDKIVDALDFPPSQTQEVPASLDATGIMPGFEIPGLVESGRARRRVVGSEPHGGLEETALQPMDLPPEPDPELGDLQDEPQDLPEFSPQEFLAHELGSGVWQPGEDLGDVRRAMAIFKAKNNISADQKMTPFEFSCFLLTTCSVRLHPSLPAKELAVRAIVQAGAQIAERHGISHFPTHFALGCDGGTVAFYYNQIEEQLYVYENSTSFIS